MDAGIGIGGLSTGKDEVASSYFDLFTPAEVENSIHKAYQHTYRPISSTSSAGPFTFEIPADPEKFTDAESLRLHGAMRIRKIDANGSKVNLSSSENVSTVNNIFDSLWSSINTKLNGTDISDPSSKWYAYKAYLENHLSYSNSSKDTILPSKGYVKDTKDNFDTLADTTKVSANIGYETRRAMFAESKWVYFCNNLHIDICTLRRYIPPNVKITMEFQRNNDQFCLLSPNSNYIIEIKDLKIKLRQYEASAHIQKYFNSTLSSGKNPILPIDRSLLKTYTVQAGTSDLSHFNIISGRQLPDQIFIGIVEEKAHQGDIKKNPYNFQDFGIIEASLVVNGVHEPSDLYKMDKSAGDKADMYFNFLENTGVSSDDREFGVSMDDYYGGSFLLAFDRSMDKCNRFHRHIMESGSMDVNIKTKLALTSTVTVIIYASYSTDIEVDGDTIITPIF